ncbi:MAG: MBL fold metallo-hydrolase [Promethearchaeota archaeon]
MNLTAEEVKEKWNSPGDHLIIVYDNRKPPNNLSSLNLKTGWGFSAAIKFKRKKVLFDCGWSGYIGLDNLKNLNITPNFDYIIISHQHWDHMGGLAYVVRQSPNAELYLPDDFSNNLTKELQDRVKKVYRIKGKNGPIEITEGIYVTGDVQGSGSIGEQSALIRGNNYDLLIVGCMHPGLKPIYELASKIIPPNAIIGGIHGFNDINYLRSTKLRNMFLGHCTQHFNLFENLRGISYKQIYTGFCLEL